jgi:hypothetical protein
MNRQKIAVVLKNNIAYARPEVNMAVEQHLDDVEHGRPVTTNIVEETIYVAKQRPASFVALVKSFTQGGKTGKVFDVISAKLSSENKKHCVIAITQANGTVNSHQFASRAKKHVGFQRVVKPEYVFNGCPSSGTNRSGESVMLVNFWNKMKVDPVEKYVQENGGCYDEITIVIDECDQGGVVGVWTRLEFVNRIEEACVHKPINVIFVTATVTNLSKSIRIIASDPESFDTSTGIVHSIVHSIVHDIIVEQYFATPPETYVKLSDFLQNYTKIQYPKKVRTMTTEDYVLVKEDAVFEYIKDLPDSTKDLALVVMSTQKTRHRRIAESLIRKCGFNVVVILNSQHAKNYKVIFINDGTHEEVRFNIPYAKILAEADKGENGKLHKYINSRNRTVTSNILSSCDITLSDILLSMLWMGTEHQDTRVDEYASAEKKHVLNAIFQQFGRERPGGYPEKPRIALVTGSLASRGNTFQDPSTDFVCSAFVYTGIADTNQCGAQSTQRMGRACGALGEVFTRRGQMPVLLADEYITKFALANEYQMTDASNAPPMTDGARIRLKNMVTEEEWNAYLLTARNKVRRQTQNGPTPNSPITLVYNGHTFRNFEDLMLCAYHDISAEGTQQFTRDDIRNFHDQTAKRIEEEDHTRKYLKKFGELGMIRSVKNQTMWVNTFTTAGRRRVAQIYEELSQDAH